MQKIIPHLWFDKEAKEAVELYISAFGQNSNITSITTLHDTPSGDADIISFNLAGQAFQAINAGPYFTFNPSISFVVQVQTKEEVDKMWSQLAEGAAVLMPLASYPFSDRYGWLQDKYGLSWQIMYSDQEITQTITPSFLFVGDVCGQAEEAIHFYMSVFHDTELKNMMRYEEGEEPDTAGTVKHATFQLEGQSFTAMDSAHQHKFAFNEAISFLVYCKNQAEIDYYWKKLSAVPEAEQCGWLKDKYGISWQIVPRVMDEMLLSKNRDTLNRVTQAFLQMKKFDISKLEEAYRRN